MNEVVLALVLGALVGFGVGLIAGGVRSRQHGFTAVGAVMLVVAFVVTAANS